MYSWTFEEVIYNKNQFVMTYKNHYAKNRMGFFKSELCLCIELLWIKYCSSSVLGKEQDY